MTRPTLADRVRQQLASGSERAPDLSTVTRHEAQLIVDSTTLAELTGDLAADLLGAGPLEPLLALAGVTDVLVNAADDVWIDRGAGLEPAEVRFADDAAVRRLAARLAAQAGRRLDDSSPFVDASLPDGTRLHAILPPLVHHPAISLRVLGRRRLNLSDLVASQALSADLAELLGAVIGARLTVLISGGTGSGKTTLLAALLALADPGERIITIEDAAELAIAHPHVLTMVARSPNIEGAGAVTLRELVRQSLRMRADRLVVGEFRGAELTELLGALNTGHTGGAATIHANSVRDIPSRLVALAALGGMDADVVMAQAASALDVLIHVRRDQSGPRTIDELALWSPSGRPPTPVWTRDGGPGPGADELTRRLVERGFESPAIPGSARIGRP